MGLTHWILVFVCTVICCFRGGYCGDLYLQPQGDHAFFSEESFFVSCNSYKKSAGDSLVWKDSHSNLITANSGRIHVDNTIDETGLALVFELLKVEDEGIYTCSSPNDPAQNASFKLTIYETIDFQDTPPIQEAKENEDFTLECNANPQDKTHVSWIISGQSLNNKDKYEQTTNGLLIKNVNSSDTGFYGCRAIIITPKKSQMKEFQIQLKVKYGPRWIKNYMKAEIKYAPLGKPVNLSCEAEGEPHPTFKWARDNQQISDIHPSFKIFEDNKDSILQINLDEDTLGSYACQAISPLSNITRTIEVLQGDPPKNPTISLNKTDGDSILFNIQPLKDASALAIKEYMVNITNKDNLDEIKTFNPYEDFVVRNLTEGRYFIRAAAMNDAGYGEFSPEIEVELKISTAEHSTVNSASPLNFALGLKLFPLFMIWLARI